MPIEAGDLVALAAAFGWAGTSVTARAMSRHVPAAWYNALRIAVAAVVLLACLPWTLGRADPAGLTLPALALLFGSVFAGFGIGDTAFFESMRRLGVARAMPIAGCHPLVTGLLAVAFLGEPLTGALILGVVVVSAGVWLVTTDGVRAARAQPLDQRDFLIGVGLALTAAVGWSVATVMVRPALATIDPILASTLRLPFAAVVMLLAASRARRLDSRRLELKRPILLGVALGGVVTVVSATLFLWAVALIGAARTAAIASSSCRRERRSACRRRRPAWTAATCASASGPRRSGSRAAGPRSRAGRMRSTERWWMRRSSVSATCSPCARGRATR